MPTSRRLRLLAVLAAAALPACGGGGAYVPPAPVVLDLGEKPSTVVSRTEVTVQNPLSSTATATAGPADGPFAFDPADLPATLPPAGTVALDVLFVPVGPGEATGTISLRFEGDGAAADQTYEVHATAEPVTWGVFNPALDFGAVTVGDSVDRQVSFINASDLSPVTFTGATLPGGGFSVLGDPFPLDVLVGEVASLDVRYAPTAAGVHDGTLLIGPGDAGGPILVQVTAEGIGTGTEVVTDYGSVSLGPGGRTSTLSVSVPADAISLYLEGSTPEGGFPKVIGLDTLTGPGGKVYENTSSTGDYVWVPGWNTFSTLVPNTDRSGVQLVPGGGTYTFSLRLLSGLASTMRVRAIVERRPGGDDQQATLPLNVWLANGITPTAATAASDSFLQAVLSRMGQILSQQGITLGDIDYYDVTDPSFDDVTSTGEFGQLLRLTSSASEVRLNLFFVRTALGGGVVGVSATIAGPKLNGTSVSGVMSVYGGFTSSTIGLIAAHELGHFLGLFHTVEQNGSHDFIDDTPNCPASGTNGTCPTPGGGLLMHWQAVGGTTITDGQGLVIRGHPHMEPTSGGGSPKPSPSALRLDPQTLAEVLSLPEGWCGTCAECAKGKRR